MADKHPQMLRARVTETGANTFTETEVVTPVVALGNSAEVMEILKVFFFGKTDGAASDILNLHLSDESQDCIAHAAIFQPAATSAEIMPIVIDLMDGNGNGILYGKDSLFFGAVGNSLAGATTSDVAILYRMKKVSLRDLLDMVRND